MDSKPTARKANASATAIGIGTTLLVHGIVTGLAVLLTVSPGMSSSLSGKKPEGPINFIPARLVRLGKPPDPNAMPQRVVPALPTAPPDSVAVSKEENPPPPKEKPAKDKRQTDALDDEKLRKVFNRARAFGEITDDYMPEGSPDGVPEGEVTDPSQAQLGDIYATKLYRLFKDRWVVPTLISEKDLDDLKCSILIQLDADLSIHNYRVHRSSGNRLFDDSVLNAIKRINDEVRRLPEPPAPLAPVLFSAGLVLRFHGKDAPKN